MRQTASGVKRGFTLIELMVAIAIVAILSIVGFAVLSGVIKSANDAKRKADIDAITKAYEVQKGPNGYMPLYPTSFASGKMPTPPEGGDYFSVTDGAGSKACAALGNNPNSACNTSATNCYCRTSSQGTITNPAALSGTHTELGIGGSSSSSCDTNGTLPSGLIGYWKMDNNTNDSSGQNNNGTATNVSYSNIDLPNSNSAFGYSGIFNGSNINLGNNVLLRSPNKGITLAAWIKPTGTTYAAIFGKYGQYELAFTNNYLVFQTNTGALADVRARTATTMSANTWHHVAFTYDYYSTPHHHLYIDGVDTPLNTPWLNGTDNDNNNITDNGLAPSANNAVIGNRYDGTIPFTGSIDDVRLYNRPLSGGSSGSEISLLAGSCLSP